MLKLPKKLNGRDFLSLDEVVEYEKKYISECATAIALYDLTNPGPHDEISEIDVLSLYALNAFGPRPRFDPIDYMWDFRENIPPLIRPVTKTLVEELSKEEYDEQIEMLSYALRRVEEVKYFGEVSTSKLIHRLRPNIMPIADSKVRKWFGRSFDKWETYLQAVYYYVTEENTLECLLTVQKALPIRLPILRIWDIILWQNTPD